MFTDINLSGELTKKFKLHRNERGAVNITGDFNVHVLTAGSWPLTGNNTEFQLPYDVCVINLVPTVHVAL
jgi:Cullin family